MYIRVPFSCSKYDFESFFFEVQMILQPIHIFIASTPFKGTIVNRALSALHEG